MRIEFEQTFDDFKEAQEAHSAASSRPKPNASWTFIPWRFGSTGVMMLLFWLSPPLGSNSARSPLERMTAILIIPAVPWICFLIKAYWSNRTSSQRAPVMYQPWERPRSDVIKPTKRKTNWKLIQAGLASVGSSVAVTFLGSMDWYGLKDLNKLVALAAGVAWLPSGIYALYAAALAGGTNRQQTIQRAWERRAHSVEHIVLEAQVAGVTIVTPTSESKVKWIGILGLVETENLFLLYRGPKNFHIAPKRAFPTPELLNAFRQMVLSLAGKQHSGFEVMPAAQTAEAIDT